MTIRAHRLTAAAAGTDTYDRHTAEAVYDFLAQILPGPRFRDAACKGPHARLWDDAIDKPGGEQAGERADRIEKAKALCQACPEQAACRKWRDDNPALGDGVFGGVLFTRRADATNTPRRGERLPALTNCQGCGTPLSLRQQRHGGRNCSEPCRKRNSAGSHPARHTPARLALTHCQACGKELSPDRQAKRARNCNADCKSAAAVVAARKRRHAGRPHLAPVIQVSPGSPERRSAAAHTTPEADAA